MDDKKEVLNTQKMDDSDIDSLTTHYKNALEEIKNKNFVKANEELDFIYRLNPNSPYYYIAKLLIEFGFSSIEELKEKADDRVVASPYFKKAENFSDEKIKKFLNSLKRQVAIKENVDKLKNAPLDQLLKMFKNQKDSGYDGDFTYSMILKYLDKKYRFVNEEFINDNGKEDTFLNRMTSVENAYRINLAELQKFKDVAEIRKIIEECEKEHEEMKKYLLTYLSLNLDTYIEKGQAEELENFLQNNYFNNEADALLLKIRSINDVQTSKLKGKHLGLIITTSVIGVTLVALAGGALGYYFLTNSTTIDGVKYEKNSSGGYTIKEVDKSYLSEHNNTLTLQSKVGGKDVNVLSRDAFYASTIKEIKNFPETITSIPGNAFYNCKGLERIELNTNSQLQVIGDSAFENCSVLTTLVLPNSLKSIGSKAFSHCEAIDNLIIPASVTSIGNNAFANTDELTHLVNNSSIANTEGSRVGLTVRNITIEVGEGGKPDNAPTTYYSWDTINLPMCKGQYYGDFTTYSIKGLSEEPVVDIDKQIVSFKPTGLKEVIATAQYDYKKEVSSEYVTYSLSTDGSHYTISSVATQKEDGTPLEVVQLLSKIGNKEVTGIERSAFEGNTVVKSISNFPKTITSIPDNAFAGCTSLTSFSFEDGSELTEIGALAFSNCSSLQSIVIPSNVTKIGANAFLNTDNLLKFTNNSSLVMNGASLGLTKRSISYVRNGEKLNSVQTAALVNSYYVSDKEITLTLPEVTNKIIADTTVKVNGTSHSLNSDQKSLTVSAQVASITITYDDESYYDASVTGNDSKYGLGFNGGWSWDEQATVSIKYFISVNRNLYGANLSLSDFDVEIVATGSRGQNYSVTLNEDSGEFTITVGSADVITIKGTVKTKITGKIIDEYSRQLTVTAN